MLFKSFNGWIPWLLPLLPPALLPLTLILLLPGLTIALLSSSPLPLICSHSLTVSLASCSSYRSSPAVVVNNRDLTWDQQLENTIVVVAAAQRCGPLDNDHDLIETLWCRQDAMQLNGQIHISSLSLKPMIDWSHEVRSVVLCIWDLKSTSAHDGYVTGNSRSYLVT